MWGMIGQLGSSDSMLVVAALSIGAFSILTRAIHLILLYQCYKNFNMTLRYTVFHDRPGESAQPLIL